MNKETEKIHSRTQKERWGPDFFGFLALTTFVGGCLLGWYETYLLPLSFAFSLMGVATGAMRWRRLGKRQVIVVCILVLMAIGVGFWLVTCTQFGAVFRR